MANTMSHCNGSIICAVDVETTGLDPSWNELCQLAILPLDNCYKPIQDIMPFNLHVRPSGPEVIDEEAVKIQKRRLDDLLTFGLTAERGVEQFIEWADRLPLPLTGGGYRARIIPLGCNYPFDYSFLVAFLGNELYNVYFHPRFRDVMTLSCSINDMYAECGTKVRYSKNNLTWLAKQHYVNIQGAHDALVDCKITAQVYKEMIAEFSVNIPMVNTDDD